MAVRGGGGHLKQEIKNRTATIQKTKIVSQGSVTDGNNLCNYTMCKYTSLSPTAVVQALLGSHMGKPSSAYGWSGGFSLGSLVFALL